MIKIFINNEALELKPDITVNIRLRNVMFNEEGTYSLPINIANTINNRKILGYPNRVANIDTDQPVYNCEIIANSFHLKGSFVVENIGNDMISGFYTDGNGEFSFLAEDKYLTDIEDDSTFYNTSTALYAAYTGSIDHSYPDTNFVCFPLRNNNLFDGSSHETEYKTAGGYINQWDFDNSVFKDNYRIPNYFLCYVLKKLFETFGYCIKSNFIENDAELRQLVLISDYVKHFPYTTYYFLPWNFDENAYEVNMAEMVPKYPIKTFIDQLRKFLACEFFINNYSKTVTIKSLQDLIKSAEYVDITSIADEYFEILFDEKESGYTIGQNLDPDDTTLATVIDISNFNRLADVEDVDDLTDLSGQTTLWNSVALVRNENAFYCYYYDSTLGSAAWRKLTDNFSKIIDEDGELDLTSNINRVSNYLYDWAPGMYHYYLNIPEVSQKAFNFPVHPLSDKGVTWAYWNSIDFINENIPRLAFWHGKQYFPSYGFYPYASGDIYFRFNSITKLADKTLALIDDGEYSFTDKYYAEYIYWYFNVKKKIKRKIYWRPIDIHKLDFSKKYRIGNQNYFISAVDITINSSGDLEIGDTEMYLV